MNAKEARETVIKAIQLNDEKQYQDIKKEIEAAVNNHKLYTSISTVGPISQKVRARLEMEYFVVGTTTLSRDEYLTEISW